VQGLEVDRARIPRRIAPRVGVLKVEQHLLLAIDRHQARMPAVVRHRVVDQQAARKTGA